MYQVGGALLANSAVYIERAGDVEARRHLVSMDYLTLVEPRQQGKSSLINRLIGRFETQKFVFAQSDLSTLDRSSESSWYQCLCQWILRQFSNKISLPNLKIPFDGNSWRNFLADLSAHLRHLDTKSVIVLDEVGATPKDWATDFFATIRSVYNSRQSLRDFQFISFIVAGAYNPKNLITDTAISNFNIDNRIRLSDFSIKEISELLSLNKAIKPESIQEMAIELHHWTSGQPYIVQWLCEYITKSNNLVNSKSIGGYVSKFIQHDTNHIPGLVAHLRQDIQIFNYAKKLLLNSVKFSPSVNDWQFYLAYVMGVIKEDDLGFCCLRNKIYEQLFSEIGSPLNNHAINNQSTKPLIEGEPISKVRILHISDLHEKGPRELEPYFRQQVLGEHWLENINTILEDGPIDAICFTGDIAQSGKPDEYAKVGEFIRELTRLCNLGIDRVFLVPGNHDIDRSINKAAWKAYRKLIHKTDPLVLSKWMAGLSSTPPLGMRRQLREEVLERGQAFWRWIESSLGLPDLLPRHSSHGTLGYRKILTLPGVVLPINIIGLDTSWLAGDESDSGNLIVTTHQLMTLLSRKDGSPLIGTRIVLMHHPIFDLFDRTVIQSLLSERADLVLRGHLHEPQAGAWLEPDQKRLPQLAAGCLYDGYQASKYPNGCQVLTLTIDASGKIKECQVHFRTWSARGHWYSDNSLYRSLNEGKLVWPLD